jgi:hypothetical protein
MSMIESFDARRERKGAVYLSNLGGAKAHREMATAENPDESNLS